jgi:hypothetical protein
MKPRILIPATLILTIAAWMILSWPLPLHVTTAIPVSAHNGGADQQIRSMIPGDALQLLYYFQLVREWFAGTTPWFFNLYEFNIGDDAARYFPGGYYAPFSLVYAAGAALAGPAFGMNLSALFSLWVTILATWLLLRRYSRDEWIVALFSLFVVFFPYRWKTLFEASPTGLAMMWVPVLILGLDMAVRDGRMRGGLLAALAIILSYLSDLHVFFFSVLITPAWCLLALAAGTSMPQAWFGRPGRMVRMVKALAPVALAAVVVVFVVQGKSASLRETDVGAGRGLGEVALFSPTKAGLFTWQGADISSQAYVGWSVTALILAGSLALGWSFLRKRPRPWRETMFWGLLVLGILMVVILALGPHGLRSGGLFSLIRELIPPYAMIRQSGKIFCLLPTLLAVAGVLAVQALIRLAPENRRAWWRPACLALACLPLFGEYTALSAPSLSHIRTHQAAYAAVARDARALGNEPRALVITLWPGDSHYASLYQHYGILYRIRMVNGYTPSIRKDYYEDIFLRFLSINQGYLSPEQVENLLERGIRYILVHEDVYPEKVAPFPVTYALKTYLNHPWLDFLGQGERVWAFRLRETPRVRTEPRPETRDWTTAFPGRHWEMESSRRIDAAVLEDDTASRGAFVRLEGTSGPDQGEVSLSPTGAPPADNLRWLVRARGQGRLAVTVYGGLDDPHSQGILDIEAADWQWLPIDVRLNEFAPISVHFTPLDGSVDLDSALLTAGHWTMLEPGQSMTLPAPIFFHAGYTDLETGRLVFQTDQEEERIIFYGPKLPLPAGRYEVELGFDSPAEPGTPLGALHLETDWNSGQGPGFPVIAGQPLQVKMDLPTNLPLNMSFVYFGHANMSLDQVRLTRVE